MEGKEETLEKGLNSVFFCNLSVTSPSFPSCLAPPQNPIRGFWLQTRRHRVDHLSLCSPVFLLPRPSSHTLVSMLRLVRALFSGETRSGASPSPCLLLGRFDQSGSVINDALKAACCGQGKSIGQECDKRGNTLQCMNV